MTVGPLKHSVHGEGNKIVEHIIKITSVFQIIEGNYEYFQDVLVI